MLSAFKERRWFADTYRWRRKFGGYTSVGVGVGGIAAIAISVKAVEEKIGISIRFVLYIYSVGFPSSFDSFCWFRGRKEIVRNSKGYGIYSLKV